jgi:hypothetical protein
MKRVLRVVALTGPTTPVARSEAPAPAPAARRTRASSSGVGWLGRVSAVLILVLGLALAPAAVIAAPATHFVLNHWAYGAVAAFNTCVPEGPDSMLCQDYFVLYTKSGSTGAGSPPTGQPAFVLEYEHFAAHIFSDGTVDEFIAETGETSDVTGSFDRARLTFAEMRGASINLGDIDPETGSVTPNGRTVTLGAFTWTSASDAYIFGNDGPFNFGLPRWYVDHCLTQISNSHNRFTTAHVTGTIDGVNVNEYTEAYLPWPGTGPADAYGAIFDNRFTVVVQGHARRGC